ncbi:MAG: CHASE2 domain-containing protein [Myxococcota bacterium]
MKRDIDRGSPAWLRLALVTVFTAIALIRVVDVVFPKLWEWSVYDVALRHFAPPAQWQDDVILVELDDQSLDHIGERWPISRARWAAILDKLARHEPAVIALDFIFEQSSHQTCTEFAHAIRGQLAASQCNERDALLGFLDDRQRALNEDGQLSATLAAIGKNILAGALQFGQQRGSLGTSPLDWLAPLELSNPVDTPLASDVLLTSDEIIAISSGGIGLVNMLLSQDGVVRRYPYLSSWRGEPYPSLALAAVMAARPERAEDLAHIAATSDRGAPLIRFPAVRKRVSLGDLLLDDSHQALRDRIVIVGITATGIPEDLTIPLLQSTVYGADLHAIAASNLLGNSYYISEGAPAWLGLLLTVFLLAAIFIGCDHLETGWLIAAGLAVCAAQFALFYTLMATVGWVIAVTPVVVGAQVLTAVEVGFRAARLQRHRRALLEQERINEAKSAFIATVSHELRTPLTSIRGSLGLVASGAMGPLPEQAGEFVGIAHSNTERLIRLVNNILDLQKLEAGKMELNFTEVEVSALLGDTVAANRAYADEFDVAVAIDCAITAHLRADRDLLIQAVTNLLSNAIKFSPKGETVRIAAELRSAPSSGKQPPRPGVRISVIDRGPGVPAAFRDRLFTRFAQASSTGDHPKGTGLGLSIVKSIVQEHDGSVGASSEEGAGSTFYIDLPVIRPTHDGDRDKDHGRDRDSAAAADEAST